MQPTDPYITLPPVLDAPVQILKLQAGAVRADLRPDLGGSIAGLWLDNEPVWRSAEADAVSRARHTACLATVPFAHRIGFRQLRWAGREHRLAPPVADAMHVAHGVAWMRPWDVVAVDARGATLAYDHAPDASWPFAFHAEQTIEVTETSLRARLRVFNRSEQPQPLGLGWRMVFDKRPHARVHLEAHERWIFDPETLLPRGKEAQGGLDAEVRWLDGDMAYEGVAGVIRVRDERLSLRLSASVPRVAITAYEGRNHWSLQWMSHAPNAVQAKDPAALGVLSVAPQAWIEAWMKVDLAKP